MENQDPNAAAAPPQQHQVPLNHALHIARGKDETYEIMQRNGFYLPKKSSALCTLEYLRGVIMGSYQVPHQDEIRIKQCPQPPNMSVIIDKLVNAAETRGKDLGINLKRKNHPDQLWALHVLSTWYPQDEIFERGYVPPK
jgi:hypothetical protein